MPPNLLDWFQVVLGSIPEHFAEPFHPLMEALSRQFRELQDERDELVAKVEALEAALKETAEEAFLAEQRGRELKNLHFGARSEKPPKGGAGRGGKASGGKPPKESGENQENDAGDASNDEDDRGSGGDKGAEAPSATSRTSLGKQPTTLPEDLPSNDEVRYLEKGARCRICGGTDFRTCREGSTRCTRRLHVQVKYSIKNEYYRQYECCGCGTSREPKRPDLVHGCRYTAAFAADVVASKFVMGVPLYRQAKDMRRYGIPFDRSAMSRMVERLGRDLAELGTHLRCEVLKSSTILADETRLPILKPGNGRTHMGQFWAFTNVVNPGGRDLYPAVLFRAADSRSTDHPKKYLKGWSGKLLTDAFAGYRKLAEQPESFIETWATCNAHARRKFVEADKTQDCKLSREILALYGKIYAFEGGFKDLQPDERALMRMESMDPIFKRMRRLLEGATGILPKSTTGKAISYFLKHYRQLRQFLSDGEIEIDTNRLERLIRPIAVVRKNALFAGSEGGADAWALFASLAATCELNGVNPSSYFRWLFETVSLGPKPTRLEDLLPWHFAGAIQVRSEQ